MAFAQLPDGQIHYEWSGPEQAPVLVFSNSLGTTHRMWDGQMNSFAQHFRVLRYDTRGHGESSATPGPYTIEQLGCDLIRMLDALGLPRVYFCGLSMGGMTGMFLGSRAPQRFHKLVLCNTAAKIGTSETWNSRIETVQKGGMKAVASAVIERWFTPEYRRSHPAETAAALQMLEQTNPEGYIANCAAVRDFDQRRTLGEIKVPALIVSGTHDPVTPPAEGQFLTKQIPAAEYTELGASHLSNIEARDEFNRQVLKFLR
jgi:3-oxoadipate enol-lactonase